MTDQTSSKAGFPKRQIVTTEDYSDDPEGFERFVDENPAPSWDVTLRMDNTDQERDVELVGYVLRVRCQEDALQAVQTVMEAGVADHEHLRSLRIAEGHTGALHVGLEPTPEASGD